MKVLILSCNTGQGHNGAGQAIFENLKERGISCDFIDALTFAGKTVSQKVEKTYNFITTRVPGIFGVLYKAGNFISNPDRKSPVYKANEHYKQQLYNFIIDNKYTVIVTPHLFPAQTLSSLKESKKLNIPCIAVATDYTSIPFWEETRMDAYIIPHKDLISDFISKGIPEEKLYSLGIPVKNEFKEKIPKTTAREILKIEQDKPMYLIMTGSMGYGNVGSLIVSILKNYGNKVNIVVMGGTNKKLKSKLRDRFARQHNVYIKGFSNRIPLYMDACDILFTKPGGLTSTEAAVKNIPVILTEPIPGCETKNALFFNSKGMAFYDDNVKNQISAAAKLIRNEQAKADMIESQKKEINSNACDDICDFILNMIKS